ncbi:hypothetical protein FBU30_006494 [Linnemannia zychae]|nr:hypothetical protein FBU30_006494 [Linnemannia zychae]
MSASKEGGSVAGKDQPPEVTEFQKELHGLFDHSRTASASKIERLTKLAFKASRYYKNIVYTLEKFITRCVPEYKLTGLYVLDSISRTSQSAKTKGSSGSGSFTGSEYVARFERNIEALFVEFTKVIEDKEKEKVKRVVEIWERSGTFSAKTTDSIKQKYFPLLETEASKAAAAAEKEAEAAVLAQAEAAKKAQESSADKAASYITSLAASLAASNSPAASIISSNTSDSPTPPATTGAVYSSSLHYSAGNTYALPSTAAAAPLPSTTTANPLLAGISDPSSALALQTLLATVSQVKAATASGSTATATPASASTTPPMANPHYSGYPNAASAAVPPPPMLMPDYGTAGQGSSSLPPVLQQLQGVLSNSSHLQQNLGFTPNNNTVVSSNNMVPSSSESSSTTTTVPTPSTLTAGTLSALSAFSALSGSNAVNPRTGAGGTGGTMLLPPGFPGGGNTPFPGIPIGNVPRDPRTAPVDPRAQALEQQPQQKPMPMDPRGDPRLMQNQIMMGTQPQGGSAQPPFQVQPLFQGVSGNGPLNLGSLLDSQGGSMLMRNATDLGNGMNNNNNINNRSGTTSAGLDGNALAQFASFMNGIQEGIRNDSHHGQNRPGMSNTGQDGYPRRGEHTNGGHSNIEENGGQSRRYGVKEDPSVGSDQIRGKIATLMINQVKFNAFIKMADRADAERCKAELGGTLVHGEVMKVGWGCGFGPRDCFDYTTGTGVIPLDRLTDTDRRWLANSVIGGFGPGEVIRGGVSVLEPNIEPVGKDGRESLPRRGGHAGNNASGRGRGRGRGRGGELDHHEDFGGVGRGRGGGGVGIGGGVGRGGFHALPPTPMSMNGASLRGESQQQHQHTPQQMTHPLPHRPQVSAIGGGTAATVKRDLVGVGGGQTQQLTGDESRRNKKSRWE